MSPFAGALSYSDGASYLRALRRTSKSRLLVFMRALFTCTAIVNLVVPLVLVVQYDWAPLSGVMGVPFGAACLWLAHLAHRGLLLDRALALEIDRINVTITAAITDLTRTTDAFVDDPTPAARVQLQDGVAVVERMVRGAGLRRGFDEGVGFDLDALFVPNATANPDLDSSLVRALDAAYRGAVRSLQAAGA